MYPLPISLPFNPSGVSISDPGFFYGTEMAFYVLMCRKETAHWVSLI